MDYPEDEKESFLLYCEILKQQKIYEECPKCKKKTRIKFPFKKNVTCKHCGKVFQNKYLKNLYDEIDEKYMRYNPEKERSFNIYKDKQKYYQIP